jgi:hypothetical protein
MNSNPTVSKIHEQTNTRMYDRNIPSQQLQAYLDVRPVMTKYSYFPIVEPRKPSNVPMNRFPVFNNNTQFNPGNDSGPWSGFASNINQESELRNQIYALQKCSQAVYVPSSQSDLYVESIKTTPRQSQNSHQLLFQHQAFTSFNPNPAPNIVGTSIFNNSTRCQIKDI